MKADFLQDSNLQAMGNYMTRLSKRQQVVSSNLANIDTPGYRTKDVSFHATFEDLLAQESMPLKANRPEHQAMGEWSFAPLEPEVYEVSGLPVRIDKNNVDLDKEMLKLGETSFAFSMMAQLLRSKFHKLGTAINDGRNG
jgi:flagellar basal-body rod protein FlgB